MNITTENLAFKLNSVSRRNDTILSVFENLPGIIYIRPVADLHMNKEMIVILAAAIILMIEFTLTFTTF